MPRILVQASVAWLMGLALCYCVVTAASAEEDGQASPRETEIPDEADLTADEALLELAMQSWTGDLDAIVERRLLRVLVAHDPLFYFVDDYQQRGFTFEMMTAFEEFLNERDKRRKAERLHVIYLPVSRDRLVPGLVEGLGDIAASNLTITPDRLEKVDFATPFTDQVKEVLVTGGDFPDLAAVEDLSGREVAVRRSSSYFESLQALNGRLDAAGKAPVDVAEVEEALGNDALAELVAAGVFPATVMDRYEALLWQQVFPKLKVQEEVVLREGGAIAWAFRKDSPQLAEAVDAFIDKNRVGSLLANILIKRYIRDTAFVEKAIGEEDRARFDKTVALFRKYAEKFDFDWLLLIAQGYQESRLDQSMVSRVGAVGLMQVLPKTAKADPINIADVREADPNVHAGAKYMRHLVDDYFDDPALTPLDRQLFATAAYNAGPNRIQRLREKAAKMGLDPNRWFNSVEILAGKEVGPEPVTYVANIFKYYVTYKRIAAERAAEDAARKAEEQ